MARSLVNWPSTSRAELPSPNSAIRSPGCAFCTAATASSTGFEIFIASFGGALELEVHECRVAVLRDLKPLSAPYGESTLPTTANGLIAADDIANGGTERSVVAVSVAALNEHRFAGLRRELLVDQSGRAAGLAGDRVVLLELDRAGILTRSGPQPRQTEPAEDRDLPVAVRSSDPCEPQGCSSGWWMTSDAPFSSAAADRGTRGLCRRAGHAGLGAFGGGLARWQETEHDHGRGGCERRGDEEADAHRLGEGVASRGEQAGAGVVWELGGDRTGRADRVFALACARVGRPTSEPSTSLE